MDVLKVERKNLFWSAFQKQLTSAFIQLLLLLLLLLFLLLLMLLSHRYNKLQLNLNFNACASVWLFLTTTVQSAILKALRQLMRRLPDDEPMTCWNMYETY